LPVFLFRLIDLPHRACFRLEDSRNPFFLFCATAGKEKLSLTYSFLGLHSQSKAEINDYLKKIPPGDRMVVRALL